MNYKCCVFGFQALREEKWLADCENDALRRDLEHATQLCVELEKGSTSAVGLGGYHVIDNILSTTHRGCT